MLCWDFVFPSSAGILSSHPLRVSWQVSGAAVGNAGTSLLLGALGISECCCVSRRRLLEIQCSLNSVTSGFLPLFCSKICISVLELSCLQPWAFTVISCPLSCRLMSLLFYVAPCVPIFKLSPVMPVLGPSGVTTP